MYTIFLDRGSNIYPSTAYVIQSHSCITQRARVIINRINRELIVAHRTLSQIERRYVYE